MIHIVPTAPHHAPSIHQIEQLCFPDPWSINSIIGEATAPHAICLVAVKDEKNDEVLGHVSMRHIINEGHINNIAVHPNHRQQGVGILLLEKLIAIAIAKEMIGLTLEVRQSNTAAINLYTKFGFEPEGIRKNYYSAPSEDAIIMWKNL